MYKYIFTFFFFLCKRHRLTWKCEAWLRGRTEAVLVDKEPSWDIRAEGGPAWQSLTPQRSPSSSTVWRRHHHYPTSDWLLRALLVQFLMIWVSNFKRFGSAILCQKQVPYLMPEIIFKFPEQDLNNIFLHCSTWISSGHKISGCYTLLSPRYAAGAQPLTYHQVQRPLTHSDNSVAEGPSHSIDVVNRALQQQLFSSPACFEELLWERIG